MCGRSFHQLSLVVGTGCTFDHAYLRHDSNFNRTNRCRVQLLPKVKADLQIDRAVVEVKQSGMFEPAAIEKYGKYRQVANRMGMDHLFITLGERYQPYRQGITKILGVENTFFLDTRGEWKRFVKRIVQLTNSN